MTYDDIMTETKKPARRPAKRAPKETVDAVATDAEPTTAPTEPKTITFLGRVMAVKLPTAEQIAAWRSILRILEKAPAEGKTVEDSLEAVDMANEVIDSVVVDDADKMWLMRGRARGEVTMENSSSIVLDALKAYEGDQPQPANRAARRARA